MARSRPRSRQPPSSITPRTTTSSTSRRTPTAIARISGPGSPAPWASGSPLGRRKLVLRVGSIVIRVDDLPRQTAFWEAALGYVRRDGDDPEAGDFVLLRPKDGVGPNVSLDMVQSKLNIPPRIHLDLYAEDQPAEVERLKGLGATEIHWDKTL